ncbi:MAG TPA: hypothetical protein VKB55_04030, partial [Nocardioidaceae bacterium]|nr:hypothetical protein [Nocardioidaceae bacterium]
MPLEHLRSDRNHALSFGSSAKAYDRFRSGYPPALFDDLTATPVRTALDVGCGTGKSPSTWDRRGPRPRCRRTSPIRRADLQQSA